MNIKNNPIWYALLNKKIDIALCLLNDIDNCDLSGIDNNGNTLLMYVCKNNMENIAMKILERIEDCNIGHINNNGITSLLFACSNKMEKVAMKLLERIDDCNIGKIGNCSCNSLHIISPNFDHNKMNPSFSCIDHYNENDYYEKTGSNWTCYHNIYHITGSLYDRYENCSRSYVIPYSQNTALMYACSNKMEKVALKILERIDDCNIGYVNKYRNMSLKKLKNYAFCDIFECCICNTSKNGNTALMYAYKNKMEKVALKMLERIDNCNIGYVNKYGYNSLIYAVKNNIENVIIHKLIKYTKIELLTDELKKNIELNKELEIKNKNLTMTK